jgi:hypothetical protein
MKITIDFTINDRLAGFFISLYKRRKGLILFTAIILFSTIAYSTSVDVGTLVGFNDGDKVMAETINQNFDSLFNKINEIRNNDINDINTRLFSTERDTEGDYIGMQARYNEENADISQMISQMSGGSIPKGIIVMWDSTTLPGDGEWVFCDGNGGSPYTDPVSGEEMVIPDLRNKFIIGAADPGYFTDNLDSRLTPVAIKTDVPGPLHSHDIDHGHDKKFTNITGEHVHDWITFSSASWDSGGGFNESGIPNVRLTDASVDDFFPFIVPLSGLPDTYYTSLSGQHKHGKEINEGLTTPGNSGDAVVYPPFTSLFYIIKTR